MERKDYKDLFIILMLVLLLGVCTLTAQAQVIAEPSKKEVKKLKKGFNKENIFDKIYKDFLKYGTFYVAGDVSNPYQKQSIDYVVRTNPSGNLYDVPVVQDATEYYEFDYRYGFAGALQISFLPGS